MRILLLATVFRPQTGGAAVVYHHLCRQLPGEISVLAPSRPGDDSRDYDQTQPFAIFRTPWLREWRCNRGPKWFRVGLTLLVQGVFLRLGACMSIIRHLRRLDPDVVCLGSLPGLYWAAALVRRFSRARTLFYIHGEEVSCATTQGILTAMLYQRSIAAMRRADGVVGVSRYTVGRIIGLGVAPEKAHLIHNGVDHDRFHPGSVDTGLLARHGLSGKRVILTVARLDPRKGHETVLRAMPQILASVPDAAYLIVGDGPERRHLEELVQSLNLQEHVVFAGLADEAELPAYYRSCELFAQPNRRMPNDDTEGFGLVFVEASASGKPVVGGQAGGVPDAVVDGETGILVDGNSVPQTAAAILRVLSDDALRASMSINGITWSRRFNWHASACALRQLCSELISADSFPAPLNFPQET